MNRAGGTDSGDRQVLVRRGKVFRKPARYRTHPQIVLRGVHRRTLTAGSAMGARFTPSAGDEHVAEFLRRYPRAREEGSVRDRHEDRVRSSLRSAHFKERLKLLQFGVPTGPFMPTPIAEVRASRRPCRPHPLRRSPRQPPRIGMELRMYLRGDDAYPSVRCFQTAGQLDVRNEGAAHGMT